MGSSDPAAGGRRRRAFSPVEKLAHLAGYEAAAGRPGGGAGYLREHGLYSSLITEWRRQRDAGVLEGRAPGEKIGRLSPEQAEIARLKAELAKARKKQEMTDAALEIMGKAHALLESLSESADSDDPKPKKR
jgi:transposase-like protein